MNLFRRQGNLKILVILFAATLLLYFPILKNPSILLNRGNDLQEYYWPVAYFTKTHILTDHKLPFWNNMFFSGTPFLSDPQSMLFYPPNIIFIILPTNFAFIFWFIFHSLLGGIGAYIAARKGFDFSRIASVFTALFYITFPRTLGFAEAGHITLSASIAWLPFILLASIWLARKPNFYWLVLWAFCLTMLFFLFPTIFAPAFVLSILFIAILWLFTKTRSLKTLNNLFLAIIITLGLISITLLPQLEWLPQTTRVILLQDRDVYPIWQGASEFIKAIYPHIFGGRELVYSLDSEKWIATGVLITFLALFGFLKLDRKSKIPLILLTLAILLLCLNNISPIHSLLMSSDWYVLSRVTTRNWFVISLIIVFLAGFGLDKIAKAKGYGLVVILGSITLFELFVLSWLRIEKPIAKREEVPQGLYEFLKSDTELFRVFCTTRCLSQKSVAQYGLQTIEGYATIYQQNYYDNFISLSQVYWERYTSTLPPPSVYKFREIQPIATILGEANVKYIVSPHVLRDEHFVEVAKFDKYLVLENTKFRTRAYFYVAGTTQEIEAPIVKYRPGAATIDATKHKAGEIVFAETWSSGWKAKTDSGKQVEIIETASRLMKFKVDSETNYVEMYYYPDSYRLGRAISIFTSLGIALYFLRFIRRLKRP